jgi:hypothetical protein
MPLSRKPLEWLLDLKANEDLSVVRGFGSLAFVRAQGRTLEERSQEKVLAMLWTIRGGLESIQSPEQFDKRHRAWVENALQVLRTNRPAGTTCVRTGPKDNQRLLKFYVDWASRPTADAAARLRPWLHSPLDKVIMEALRSHDTDTWRRRIWEPHYRGRAEHQQRASMSSVNEPAYRAWQSWIRELSPEKPVLIDALWSLLRPMGKREA